MLKKPIWSAIETTLFYYSGSMYSWSSLTVKKVATVILEKEKKIRTLILPTFFNRWTYRSSFRATLSLKTKSFMSSPQRTQKKK